MPKLRQKDGKKTFALVKWVGDGIYHNTYTAGIDITDIKDFDKEALMKDEIEPDKIHVVEWHDSKKEPLGGWTCHNAMVIAVSDSSKTLEKKLDILDGLKSQDRVVVQFPTDEKLKSPIPEEIKVDSDAKSAAKKLKYDSEYNEFSDETSNDDPSLDKKRDNKSMKDKNSLDLLDQENILDTEPTTSQNNSYEAETDNKYVTKAEFSEAVSDIMAAIKGPKQPVKKVQPLITPTQSLGNDENVEKKPSRNDMKELGHVGSNVFITKAQRKTAKNKPSFTAMTTSLLMSTFSRETLLQSNYKGGASKNTTSKDARYKALDKEIIGAIKETVQAHYDNFTEGGFGTAINNKCAKVREASRNEKETKEKEAPKNDDNGNSFDE